MSDMPLDELRESVRQGREDYAAGRYYTDAQINEMLRQQIAAHYHLTEEEEAAINLAFDEEDEGEEYDLKDVFAEFEVEQERLAATLAVYRGDNHEAYYQSLEPLRQYILNHLPDFKRTEIIELLTEVDPDFYDEKHNNRPVEKL